MSEIDHATRYFNKISSIDLLTREQEIDLARRMEIGVDAARRIIPEVVSLEDGNPKAAKVSRGRLLIDALAHADDSADEDDLALVQEGVAARKAFIEANLRLALAWAGKYRNSGFPADDLVQFATEGVIAAVDTYDPRKAAFSTHGVSGVRFALTRNIDNLSRLVRVPVNIATELRELNRAISVLSADRVEFPKVLEIAEHMGSSTKRVEELMQLRMSVASLDVTDEKERGTVGDLLPDTNFPSPEDQVVEVDDTELVEMLLSKLGETDPKGAEVVRRKFGIGGEAMSNKQIATELKISPRTVSPVREEAIVELQKIAAGLYTDEPRE